MVSIRILCLSLLMLHSMCLVAGPEDLAGIKSSTMGVGIENEGKKLVLVFESTYDKQLHTVIDLDRATDLEYKTRIMRYFGGMLKNDTYHFESIQVIWGDEDFEMEFNRTNVATIINSILAQIE